MFTWGSNTEGQLGGFSSNDGRDLNSLSPWRVDTSGIDREHVIGVSCGHKHTLAWTRSGKLYAWGDKLNCAVPEAPHPSVVAAHDSASDAAGGLVGAIEADHT